MTAGFAGLDHARQRPWLLVGLSVRPLAEVAAAAGHAICAIDAFADRETATACAGRCVKLSLCDDWRIGSAMLRSAVAEARQRFAPEGFAGVVAGAGIEAEPQLLDVLAAAAPLHANHAGAVAAVRDPARWFALLDRIGAPHPEVSYRPPLPHRGWLIKSARGSGGRLVRRWRGEVPPSDDVYFQRLAPGLPASALFVADGCGARVIGWQWQMLAPSPELPWRYGGVVTAQDMPPPVRKRVADIVDGIAGEAGLRGLGGLDFLVDGHRLQVLEVNPRPTASVALYPQLDVFALHCEACAGRLPGARHAFENCPAVGEAVLYADVPLRIPADYGWPDGCCDLASAAAVFAPDQPVCSLRAAANTTAGVRIALGRRLHALATALQENCADELIPHQRQRLRRTARPLRAC